MGNDVSVYANGEARLGTLRRFPVEPVRFDRAMTFFTGPGLGQYCCFRLSSMRANSPISQFTRIWIMQEALHFSHMAFVFGHSMLAITNLRRLLERFIGLAELSACARGLLPETASRINDDIGHKVAKMSAVNRSVSDRPKIYGLCQPQHFST